MLLLLQVPRDLRLLSKDNMQTTNVGLSLTSTLYSLMNLLHDTGEKLYKIYTVII